MQNYNFSNRIPTRGSPNAYGRDLESALIPDGVTEIEPYVFYEFKSLNSVSIPNTVTTLGSYAFYGCSGLDYVLIEASSVPQWRYYGSAAFDSTNDCPILVPSGCVDTYKTTWSNYSTRIGSRLEDIPVNLSKEGTANCYIVKHAGTYQFVGNKMGNSNLDVSPGVPSSVEVLWESVLTPPVSYYNDYGYGHEIGTLISDIQLINNRVLFTSNGEEGNALVAVRNSAGKILWSWHLWFTSDTIEEIPNPTSSAILMDRNLGAMKNDILGDWNSYKNVPTHGLLYQWGRKDPFVGRDYALWDVVSTVAEGLTAIQNPTTLYDNISGVGWLSTKSTADPCPPGWRVPSVNSWPIMKSGDDQYSYGKSLSNCYWIWSYELNGEGIYHGSNWYPAAGHITKQGGEYLHDCDYYTGRDYGCYWAASDGSYTTPYLYIDFATDEENMLYYIEERNNDWNRNMAMSVRCQKEE